MDEQNMDNVSASPQKKSLSLATEIIVEITVVTISLILIFGLLNYYNILSISTIYPRQFGWLPQKSISKATAPNTSAQLMTQKTLELPIASNDTGVISLTINYVLLGKIVSIAEANGIKTITVETPQKKQIVLPITGETRIERGTQEKQVPLAYSQLKKDMNISTSVVYTPKTNTWKTWSVFSNDSSVK